MKTLEHIQKIKEIKSEIEIINSRRKRKKLEVELLQCKKELRKQITLTIGKVVLASSLLTGAAYFLNNENEPNQNQVEYSAIRNSRINPEEVKKILDQMDLVELPEKIPLSRKFMEIREKSPKVFTKEIFDLVSSQIPILQNASCEIEKRWDFSFFEEVEQSQYNAEEFLTMAYTSKEDNFTKYNQQILEDPEVFILAVVAEMVHIATKDMESSIPTKHEFIDGDAFEVPGFVKLIKIMLGEVTCKVSGYNAICTMGHKYGIPEIRINDYYSRIEEAEDIELIGKEVFLSIMEPIIQRSIEPYVDENQDNLIENIYDFFWNYYIPNILVSDVQYLLNDQKQNISFEQKK